MLATLSAIMQDSQGFIWLVNDADLQRYDGNQLKVVRDYRLRQAYLLLNNGEQVAVIADAVGFASSSYFGRCFKAKYSKTPNDYRIFSKCPISSTTSAFILQSGYEMLIEYCALNLLVINYPPVGQTMIHRFTFSRLK